MRCQYLNDGDLRCTNCRERSRPCSELAPSRGGDDEVPRAQHVCRECKRRKRACVGAEPRSQNGTVVGMTSCAFCTKHGLECRWATLDKELTKAGSGDKGRKHNDGAIQLPLNNVNEVPASAFRNPEPIASAPAVVPTVNQLFGTGLGFELDLSAVLGPAPVAPLLGSTVLPSHSPWSLPEADAFSDFSPTSATPRFFPFDVSLGTTQSGSAAPDDGSVDGSYSSISPRPLPDIAWGPPLPSTECLNWLITTFFDFHAEMGRNVAINRARFLAAAVGPSGDASPSFWILLWGTTVLLDKDSWNRNHFQHPDLNISAKRAIVERSRTALFAGLQSLTSDMAALGSQNRPSDIAEQSAMARRIVPLLQGLILGMLFYERAGGTRNMVALVSLIIRLGSLAATVLKGWILHVTSLTRDERPPEARVFDEEPEIEEWMRRKGIQVVVPYELSLAYHSKSPTQLALLPPWDVEEIILLNEFASCFFYTDGVEVWASDLLGTPLINGSAERDHVPIPFDARGFDCNDVSRNPYLGFGRLERFRRVGMPRPPKGIPLLSVVNIGFHSHCLGPNATTEEREYFFTVVIKDSFRSGPHKGSAIMFHLERMLVTLRFRALQLGFPRVYPDGVRVSPEIAAEHARLRAVTREALDFVPPEVAVLEKESRIEELVELTMDCPHWVGQQNWTGYFIWMYESLASSTTPPPGLDPDPDWYASNDGIEAATNAVLASRIIGGLIECGYDVNNRYLLSWYHTRIDRLARIVHLHLQHSYQRGLPTWSLFFTAMNRYLNWFRGLEGKERYNEWIERLDRTGATVQPGRFTMSAVEEEEAEALYARMVVSSEDRRLAKFRTEMESISNAVQSL